MGNDAIIAENLSKAYSIYAKPLEKYLDFFLPMPFGRKFYALRDISFSLEQGHSIGLLGLNGSGKSTLANIIAGASALTDGKLEIHGNVSMTAVSGGVTPLLTGRENIVQKCLLLGLSRKEIDALMPDIIEFSELGDVIDQQVKTYSSGMRAKLGFAISINIDPDTMVIDEALSVGDPTFTDKCLQRMKAFRDENKTIVFVSHALPQVRDFCDCALWLEGGYMRAIGNCDDVTKEYSQFISWFNQLSSKEQKEYKENIRKKQLGEKK